MSNTAYQHIEQQLQDAGITLNITRKRVKNINFRIKPYQLNVSAPYHVLDKHLIVSIQQRINWALKQHAYLLKRQQIKSLQQSENKPLQTRLWGEPQPIIMGENERLRWYRHELKNIMPSLFAKWQPIVGTTANETRIKKMTTRWGSCNTQAGRIWLSVYLPYYPIGCTEYVIVHELCHLHHANHSAKFWAQVGHAMPDYKYWHDLLAGKTDSVD